MDVRVTGSDPSNGQGEPEVFTWCTLAAFVGMAFGFTGKFTHTDWALLIGAVLLLGAAVVAIANGWIWGNKAPSETRGDINARIGRGLVGTSIMTYLGVATVVDDSVSGGDRLRRTVKAVDEAGRIGVLFVELDRTGRVVAAAAPGGQWAPAQSIS